MVDLLAAGALKSGETVGLNVIEDKSGNSVVRGLAIHIANSEEEALNYLFEGETNRSISEHQLNKCSTRYREGCLYCVGHIVSLLYMLNPDRASNLQSE
jgi:hypothetical protein